MNTPESLTRVAAPAAAALLLLTSPAPRLHAAELDVQSTVFGTMPDRTPVHLYTLTNRKGMRVQVITHGATLVGVEVPDRHGKVENVTLHLDSWEQYLAGHPSLGSTVGRFANRIGNARFTIDGQSFEITPNAKPHHIHGGKDGFGKKVWSARPLQKNRRVGVELTLVSPDGDEGYPGKLTARAVYWLNDENEMEMEYFAETDQPTHINLTNHAYWNLGGAGSGKVLDHRLQLNAKSSLAIDDKKIPTGELLPVKGTPLDFTKTTAVGERIEAVGGGGYDHCYVVDRRQAGELALAARVEDPASGRVMEVLTTQPGVQLYTANYLSDKLGTGGKSYGPHHAICLEAQAFPDAPNQPAFPSSLLRPGQTYHQRTVHRFTVMK